MSAAASADDLDARRLIETSGPRAASRGRVLSRDLSRRPSSRAGARRLDGDLFSARSRARFRLAQDRRDRDLAFSRRRAPAAVLVGRRPDDDRPAARLRHSRRRAPAGRRASALLAGGAHPWSLDPGELRGRAGVRFRQIRTRARGFRAWGFRSVRFRAAGGGRIAASLERREDYRWESKRITLY